MWPCHSINILSRHQAEDVWPLKERMTLMEEMMGDRTKDMKANADLFFFYLGTISILIAFQLVDGQDKLPIIYNDFFSETLSYYATRLVLNFWLSCLCHQTWEVGTMASMTSLSWFLQQLCSEFVHKFSLSQLPPNPSFHLSTYLILSTSCHCPFVTVEVFRKQRLLLQLS